MPRAHGRAGAATSGITLGFGFAAAETTTLALDGIGNLTSVKHEQKP